jgi:hypothetical protein
MMPDKPERADRLTTAAGFGPHRLPDLGGNATIGSASPIREIGHRIEFLFRGIWQDNVMTRLLAHVYC